MNKGGSTKGFASSFRLGLVCFCVFTAFIGVGARLVYLQVLERDELVRHVEKARKQITVVKARRGDVLDANGNILGTSRSLIELGVDPQTLRKEDRAKWPELARLLGIGHAELAAAIGSGLNRSVRDPDGNVRLVQWVKLQDEVDEETYARILELGIRGVYGNRHYKRVYPGGRLASHLLGFINREEVPVTGVERHMDFYLRGEDGWRESERDGLRRELAQFRTREVRPADGYDVVLSIDMFVQHVIEEELRRLAAQYSPQSATIIVSDPATGWILGLANYPDFDLNEFNRAEIAHQRNLAVTDMFEPGSTFKIVPAAGALNEGLVHPETRIDCSVEFVEILGRRRALPSDSHPLGILSVAEVVAKSSNRGAAHLGIMLGAHRLHDYSRRFGFGQRTDFPLGGEVAGVLHPVRSWDGLTITRLPMGHAVAATPLQIHMAMGAIAGGGVLMKPQIIRQIRDRQGFLVHAFEPASRQRVVSMRTAQTVALMLQAAASQQGTAREAMIPGYEVAGKTGTTRKIIDGRYSNRHHIASFVGFFPASDPRLLISVFVDDASIPGAVAYGGRTAAPSFRRVGEQLAHYLGIKPPGDASAKKYLAMERTPL